MTRYMRGGVRFLRHGLASLAGITRRRDAARREADVLSRLPLCPGDNLELVPSDHLLDELARRQQPFTDAVAEELRSGACVPSEALDAAREMNDGLWGTLLRFFDEYLPHAEAQVEQATVDPASTHAAVQRLLPYVRREPPTNQGCAWPTAPHYLAAIESPALIAELGQRFRGFPETMLAGCHIDPVSDTCLISVDYLECQRLVQRLEDVVERCVSSLERLARHRGLLSDVEDSE